MPSHPLRGCTLTHAMCLPSTHLYRSTTDHDNYLYMYFMCKVCHDSHSPPSSSPMPNHHSRSVLPAPFSFIIIIQTMLVVLLLLMILHQLDSNKVWCCVKTHNNHSKGIRKSLRVFYLVIRWPTHPSQLRIMSPSLIYVINYIKPVCSPNRWCSRLQNNSTS